MSKHSFTSWLHSEIATSRCALLTLYEQRDKLKYIDGPRLEKEYMEKVGTYEETVIREEIECELLQKKQQMIQAVINRREPIDESAIDAELDVRRQQMFQEAAGPTAPQNYAELTSEQGDELQELYRDIVENFHPQIHSELTAVQHQLFQKAQEAYRRRDLAALKLIHEMLFSTMEDDFAVGLRLNFLTESNSECKEEIIIKRDYATDYSLASQIYCCFNATVEEAALREEWGKYRQMTNATMQEMEEMRSQFPYTAAEMLSDLAQIEAYKEDLAQRLRTASAEKERREKEIQAMMGREVIHE